MIDIMSPLVWCFSVQHRFVDFSGNERPREPPSDVDLAVSAAGKKARYQKGFERAVSPSAVCPILGPCRPCYQESPPSTSTGTISSHR
jgi:hypothetical protein